MLGLAALLAAGTANAETADDRFLGTLQQQCIGFGNTQSAITVAHHVCDALGQGTEPSDISSNIAARTLASIDRPPWSPSSTPRSPTARSTCTRWPTAPP